MRSIIGATWRKTRMFPRSQEDYITQFPEEIEGRVKKRLSQAFSRTKNHILGALARLDDFLMNPLSQGHSGTARETSRIAFGTNPGTREDDSQSHPHSEAGFFSNQTTQNSGAEIGHGMGQEFTKKSLTAPQYIFGKAEKEPLY